MGTFWNDIRYGLRMLAANPAFTAVAILSLALGIGATTSIFSFTDALLLRPLPVERPSEIVRVFSTSKAQPYGSLSYADFVDLRSQTKTLSGLAGFQIIPLAWNADVSAPAQVRVGLAVSPNFFDVLGVRPAVGRGFREDENRATVVILSDWLWESQFGRDPSVIGRTVRVSKIEFTVVGVAPKSFPGIDRIVHEGIYVPLGVLPRFETGGANPLEKRDHLTVSAYGRIAPGQSGGQVQAELLSIASNLERTYPETNRGRSVRALSEIDSRLKTSPEDGMQSGLLLALSLLVLLIACANVASLLLARARARSREIGIRLAIGAGRARLFRQLVTESMLLGLTGGAAGLLLSVLSIRYFASIRLPTDFPVWLVAQLDLRVLLFCGVASLASGLVFGVAPALKTLKTDLSTTLKSGDAAPAGKRVRFQVRSLLVAGQVAVALALLLVAGLLVKDFSNLLRFRPGFRTDHMLVMFLDPELIRYQEPQTRAFYRQLLERLEGLPGVRGATLGRHVPLGFTSSSSRIVVEGYEMPMEQTGLSVLSNVVDNKYFETMKIQLASGRAFDRRDTASSPPVAVINETMAREYWPKRSAMGGRIRVDNKAFEVVGIAKDIKYRDINEHSVPFLYLPFSQHYSPQLVLHVETAGDPAGMAAPVLAEIRRLDPGQPVQEVQTLDHFFEEGALFGNRLIMRLVTAIGLLGLLLATTGLYGVVAYAVSRRTREIGIRMAVGAEPRDVAGLILRQGLKLTLIGVVGGVGLALVGSGLIQTQLVGISARDPWVYVGVSFVLASISLLACYIPARRASRVDPVQALRQE